MSFFVTGATGFLGRYLVRELLARSAERIYVLVRSSSRGTLEALRPWWGPAADRVIAIEGDATLPLCGMALADRDMLRTHIRHFWHLAATYDMNASEQVLELGNVAGTRYALELARDFGVECFHLCSSIAVAGRFDGTFTEDMFAEAYGHDHPYFRTKYESERLVRAERRFAWRIYRPGMIVGDSQTGHITKVDGPYYVFKALQMLRRVVPAWVPTIGIEGGYMNLVPVDYVSKSMAYLCQQPGLDRRCFHLTDPQPRRLGEVLNVFARVAHAPTMGFRIDTRLLKVVPDAWVDACRAHAPLRAVLDQVLEDLHLPRAVIEYANAPTRFDSRATRAVLERAGIAVPSLEDYAWRLWDYWERNLDPDLSEDRSLAGAVRGKRVLITGGSAGIGRATALRIAQAGADVIIVARDAAKLDDAADEIRRAGAHVAAFSCDIADEAGTRKLVADVNAAFGGIDVLINNAGHSIRRSIDLSLDRVHDYERLMQLNYFAALRLTLAFLPGMLAQKAGHVIAISSIGVLNNSPRFSAYVASKAALESFTRCAAAEYRDRNVHFTVVNMPLVHTAMSAPTRAYDELHMLTPHEAASLVVQALIHRPPRLVSGLGQLAQFLEAIAPRFADVINNAAFHMFPDSAAARGQGAVEESPTEEAVAFAKLMKGLHW